jgi:hypothetical protein
MNPQCIACKVPLVEGFLYDKGHGGRGYTATWIEGKPEWSVFSGIKANERRTSVAAYLCPQCGRIELYAAPGNESV